MGIGLGSSLAIALGLTACSQSWPRATSPTHSSIPTARIDANQPAPTPIPTFVPVEKPYERAIDKAISAEQVGKTALTAEDWQLAALKWQQAIDLIRQVPRSSPQWAAAQQKQVAYQKSLKQAQQAATQAPTKKAPPAGAIARSGSANTEGLFVPKATDGNNPLNKTPGSSTKSAAAFPADGAGLLTSLNQKQIAFFSQQKRFANSLAELGNPAPPADYLVNLIAPQPNQALATAIAQTDGKPSYSAAVFMVKGANNQETPIRLVCATPQPSKVPPAMPQLNSSQAQCPAGAIAVGG
jgi:hypothetical protein